MADAAAAPAASTSEGPRNISRDGANIADMEYYDLLGVSGNVSELDLKKAYRKAAIKNHPDKGGDEERFKMIGEAYRVLSDNHLRADYDKHGKKKPTEEVGLKEATEMFGNLFGGEKFIDLVGEISLLRDFGKASEIMMTDEEREELEKQMKAEQAGEDPKVAAATATTASATGTESKTSTTPSLAGAAAAATPAGETTTDSATTSNGAPAAGATSTHMTTAEDAAASTKTQKPAKQKITPEQRAKLEELEKEKREAEEKRIRDLTEKLKERIRPFVDARKPGEAGDSETEKWGKRMKEEAEDLKLESFGVELLHTIGGIYLTKSTTWVKSQRHNFLGVPGFFSRLKEKGTQVKETWGLLGSAMSVLVSMEDMQRRQEKGDVDEEEMRKMEQEMSGKMLLATWRGTRSEVNNVLRKVCDNILSEKGVDNKTLLHRARALAYLGAVYKNVQPEEGDDERRELERLVAEAAGKGKKKKDKKAAGLHASHVKGASTAPGTAAGATPGATTTGAAPSATTA